MLVGKRQSIIGSLIVSVIRRSGASGISLRERVFYYISFLMRMFIVFVTEYDEKLTSPNS